MYDESLSFGFLLSLSSDIRMRGAWLGGRLPFVHSDAYNTPPLEDNLFSSSLLDRFGGMHERRRFFESS